MENSEHIDAERAKRNIYWDCYRGITTSDNRNADAEQDFSFEKVEQMYYTSQYSDFIFFQNERNIKNRHPERNRTVEELGIPLSDPTKPKGRHNNRKQTFDAMCREMLFEICERYGLHLEYEPIYGGKSYLEKNDFIIEKQKQDLEVVINYQKWVIQISRHIVQL